MVVSVILKYNSSLWINKNSSDSLWLEDLRKSGVSGFVGKDADTIQQTNSLPFFLLFSMWRVFFFFIFL